MFGVLLRVRALSTAPLDILVGFAEGRLSAEEFEARLQGDSGLETLLGDDPQLPPHSYVGSSVFQYLLQLDLSDPGDLLSAQGAVSQWLDRHAVSHAQCKEAAEFYDLLLDAQPKWLDVDSKWLNDQVVSRAGGRRGDELRSWLRAEILSLFKFATEPPQWIQSPSWPIGPHGPLIFLAQVDVPDYFHDVAAAYVFYDPQVRECTTILQVA